MSTGLTRDNDVVVIIKLLKSYIESERFRVDCESSRALSSEFPEPLRQVSACPCKMKICRRENSSHFAFRSLRRLYCDASFWTSAYFALDSSGGINADYFACTEALIEFYNFLKSLVMYFQGGITTRILNLEHSRI